MIRIGFFVFLIASPLIKGESLLNLEPPYQKFGTMYSTYEKNYNHTYFVAKEMFNDNDREVEEIHIKNWANGDVYDFIVIGGGTAGSVVASRLAENPHWRVLLLEAGKIEKAVTKIPLASYKNLLSGYNWGYLTEYQKDFGRGVEMHKFVYPTGMGLGGTSILSPGVYVRGNPQDYDDWSYQNEGWSYQKLLPHFLRAEKCHLDDIDWGYHNQYGKLSVERPLVNDLVKIFVEAGYQIGYQKYCDYNSMDQLGFSPSQANLFYGRKQTPSKAYLFPYLTKQNLDVLTRSYVTKILVDAKNGAASGVEFFKNGRVLKAYATKEIVLSAGAVNSPQILMLSGIGPKKHLEELGIGVIKDLSVGENFQDHVRFFGMTFLATKQLTYTFLDVLKPANLKYFWKTGKGVFRSVVGDAIGFIRTNNATIGSNRRPDAQLLLSQISPATDYGVVIRKFLRFTDDVYKKLWAPLSKIQTFNVVPSLLRPKSRGTIRLRSADPFAYPLIYGNFMSDPEGHDVKTLIGAIRVVLEMSRTKVFKDNGIILNHVAVPGCELYEKDTDGYWECAIRTLGYPDFNPSGTVKMGPEEDPGSCVNEELKVYGVKGLRVADCSIMPEITSGFTGAPAVVIGEKAAHMITKEWKSIVP